MMATSQPATRSFTFAWLLRILTAYFYTIWWIFHIKFVGRFVHIKFLQVSPQADTVKDLRVI